MLLSAGSMRVKCEGLTAGTRAFLALSALGGCSGRQSVLAPAGEPAASLATLFIVMLCAAIVLWLLVNGGFFFVTQVRPRQMSRRFAETLIIVGGIAFPSVVLAALLGYGLSMMSDQRAPGDGLVVRVTGEQWWWRVEYWPEGADAPIISANEVRLPAGRRSDIVLTSDSVIHSFWVPSLGGKMDMFPGRETRLTLAPETPGIYRGQCAEFCGASHALMAFETVVMPQADFDAWLASIAAPAAEPQDSSRPTRRRNLRARGVRRLPPGSRHSGAGQRRTGPHQRRRASFTRRRHPRHRGRGFRLLDRPDASDQAQRRDALLRPSAGGRTGRPRHIPEGSAMTDATAGRIKSAALAEDLAPSGPYPPTPEMLDEPVAPEVQEAQKARLRAAWKTPPGWRYWSAVNNSEVGVWYSLTAFFFMLAAGVLALLMRIQLAVPGNDFLDADRFNQFFTMHGSAMMFLFAVPMFEAISILILPAFLGARDMPFPRLSAYGFWCFVIGGVFVFGSVLFDAAPKAGWFMYPPLATQELGIGSDIWLLGLSFIEVASIAAAVELIVGTLKCRPPGMRVNLMPLYAWYVLVVGGMILFAFPPLIAGDFLFELERSFDWPFFDPERGGDPLLWQHLFWIFGHPEVYIVFLPSIAIAAMVIPTVAQTPIVGYSWIVLSAVGTGFLSFGLWVHHMFTTGLPALSLGFFSAASEAVVIPTGIQLFAFLATLIVGKVTMSIPMLWLAGAIAIFTGGGLTGVMIAIAPFDWQVHDTYFIVAHLHYTLFGGMIFPVIGGVYYFYPFFAKRLMSERLGRISFWLTFIGFNVTFLPMHLTGLLGMPRRVYTYPGDLGWTALNMISSAGAFIIAAGILVFAWDLVRPKGRQARIPRNPWKAGTLEWSHDVPEEAWGVRSIPYIESRYPLWDQKGIVERIDAGRYYLPDAEGERRETLVTSVIDATPIQILRVTGPAWITIWAAIFTGGAFIFPTFHLYSPAIVSGILAIGCIIYWLWTSTAQVPEEDMGDAGLGLRLPRYVSGPNAVGWWGVWITMLGDATAFSSLIFGFFFYWTSSASFPPAGAAHATGWLVAAATAGFSASWALTVLAREANARGGVAVARASLLVAAIASAAAIAAIILSVLQLEPTSHVYPAVMWALMVWLVAHVGAGIIMQLYCLAGSLAGRMTPRYDADLRNVTLFWHFVCLTALVTGAVMGIAPRML